MEGHDWSAWYNRMPGVNDPDLHVAGTMTLPSSSIQLSLRPAPEIVDEPDLQVLELVADEPPVGDTQVVEREVSWQEDVGPNIRRVRIQGATTAEIPVTDAV
jgi:hypothetical protein